MPIDSHPTRLGLCFSGGGLRATFFHLGVIRALRTMGMLNDVTHICAVSGGGILAAHLVLNWKMYNGSEKEFATVTEELRKLGKKDIRNRILRRWPLGRLLTFGLPRIGFLSRTDLLIREYEVIYKRKKLSDIVRVPELHLLSTDFTTGLLCSFSQKGFFLHEGDEISEYPADNIPIALAVAASSAFPPLFPPVRITAERIGSTNRKMPYISFLTDGGVFDNLGVEKIFSIAAGGASFDKIIISDASARFDWNVSSDFHWVISRTSRATDILMNRVAENTLNFARRFFNEPNKVLHVSISSETNPHDTEASLPITIQHRLASIRTDLDLFSDLEQRMLSAHGFQICRAQLQNEQDQDRRLVRLRHKPRRDRAHAVISGKNSHLVSLSNSASSVGSCNL